MAAAANPSTPGNPSEQGLLVSVLKKMSFDMTLFMNSNDKGPKLQRRQGFK